jgi:hypothetical protein
MNYLYHNKWRCGGSGLTFLHQKETSFKMSGLGLLFKHTERSIAQFV